MLAFSLRTIGSTYVLLIMLALAFSGFAVLYYRRPRHTMTIAKRMNGATELKTTSKVVTLTQETATADHN